LSSFIDENWNNIDFGAKLERYKTKEQDGRQFSAGPWSIDLCKDIDSGDFVVIELKRGKTSDTVVGQTLRYIKWVRENLASPSQNVRGLIIAKEVDQSLQYSLRATKDVSVLTYKVSFGLKLFSA
jgi:restriction system protein